MKGFHGCFFNFPCFVPFACCKCGNSQLFIFNYYYYYYFFFAGKDEDLCSFSAKIL